LWKNLLWKVSPFFKLSLSESLWYTCFSLMRRFLSCELG
jgi:hypothetical protein